MSTSSSDPYQVLGVPTDADEETIRRAYREAALRDHPDRNPGDLAAEERFKAASEAYATLRDPDARRRYDAYRDAGMPAAGMGMGGAPMPDFANVDWRVVFQEAQVPWASSQGGGSQSHPLFDALYRGVQRAFRQAGLLPGEDRVVPLTIDLATARAGAVRKVHLPGPLTCPTCMGAGADASGVCTACGGARRLRSFEAEVRVPAGVRPGQKLRLQGLGGPGRPPGDAYVELALSLPYGVRAEGRDLLSDLNLTAAEAHRGLRLDVLGASVQVPAGSLDGQTLRVPGGGLSGGDLLLSLRIDELRGTMRSATDWLGATASALLRPIGDAWRSWQRRNRT